MKRVIFIFFLLVRILLGHEETSFEETLLEYMYSHGGKGHVHEDGRVHVADLEALRRGIEENFDLVKEIARNEEHDAALRKLLSFASRGNVAEHCRTELQNLVIEEKNFVEFPASVIRIFKRDSHNFSNEQIVDTLNLGGRSLSEIELKIRYRTVFSIYSVVLHLAEVDVSGESSKKISEFLENLDRTGLDEDSLNALRIADEKSQLLVRRRERYENSVEKRFDIRGGQVEPSNFTSGESQESSIQETHSLLWLYCVLGVLLVVVGIMVLRNPSKTSQEPTML